MWEGLPADLRCVSGSTHAFEYSDIPERVGATESLINNKKEIMAAINFSGIAALCWCFRCRAYMETLCKRFGELVQTFGNEQLPLTDVKKRLSVSTNDGPHSFSFD